MLIPLSEPAKNTSDVAVAGVSLLGFFKLIPWPEISAFLACAYMALRIIELVWGWFKKTK